jgi:DNA-directed RNA polymerase subunit K/omega
MKTQNEFSKYERARILGARGLQIAMDAPMILKMESEEMDNLNFDPLKLAEKELDSGVLPIAVKRPMPEKHERKLKEVVLEERTPGSDEKKVKEESTEEKEISESGEIMELVEQSDEAEEDFSSVSDGKEEIE